MSRRLVLAGLMLLLIDSWSTAAMRSPDTSPEGVYAITVCHGPCASELEKPAKLEGTLVLLAEWVPDDVVEALGRNGYGHKAIEGRPNGCFRLRQARGFDGSVLPESTELAELVHWTRQSDGTVDVSLFRSPDAGYAVQMHAGARLKGSGGRWPARPQMDEPVDEIVGRRIGSAKSGICAEPSRLTWP